MKTISINSLLKMIMMRSSEKSLRIRCRHCIINLISKESLMVHLMEFHKIITWKYITIHSFYPWNHHVKGHFNNIFLTLRKHIFYYFYYRRWTLMKWYCLELGKNVPYANLFERRINNIMGKRKKESILVDVQTATMFDNTEKDGL